MQLIIFQFKIIVCSLLLNATNGRRNLHDTSNDIKFIITGLSFTILDIAALIIIHSLAVHRSNVYEEQHI